MRRTSSPWRGGVVALSGLVAGLAFASPALAEGTSLRAELVEDAPPKLDGVPKEWSALSSLTYAQKGRSSRPDCDAKAAIAYDSQYLYVAADVTDDVLRGGGDGDRIEVVIGFPGQVVHSLLLFPGDPGKSPGSAKVDGAPVGNAKVVEAPRTGGWTLEARVPWSAFPEARQVRVGLRGALFFHDVDSGTTVKNLVGTAPSASYGSLPPISTESEQSLFDGLVKEKGLKGAPRFNLLADVAGGPMKERVLVYDRYLVVLGSDFRKGKEYYYHDLGVDPSNVVSVEVKDLNGDGQSEIVIRKKFGSPSKLRELYQVLSFGSSETPTSIFAHEIGITTADGSIQNEVELIADGGSRASIKVRAGVSKGYHAGNYKEPIETSVEPMLFPWGTVASQTWRLSGGVFVKAAEEKQAAVAPPAAPQAPQESHPVGPPPPSPAELQEKVYDLYKHDRGASGRPRFDMAIDVGGDGQAERVLLHDRDLVIFGKGWKGGTGYTYLTLQHFASASDILDVTARDLTGDGKAEIIVRGLLHSAAPASAGGGTIDREVMLVFQVSGDQVRRVFGAEVARSMGHKKIAGSVRFGSGSVELGPGQATDWTEKSYPFNQDSGPVGGLEPLQLPWSGTTNRYRWSGSGFSK